MSDNTGNAWSKFASAARSTRAGSTLTRSQADTGASDNAVVIRDSAVQTASGGLAGGNISGSTITVGNPGETSNVASILGGILGQTNETLGSVLQSSLANQATQQTAGQTTLQGALDQTGQLAADQASGGQSSANKTVLWIVLALLGVLAFIFWRRGR